jgi:hypothetical protein
MRLSGFEGSSLIEISLRQRVGRTAGKDARLLQIMAGYVASGVAPLEQVEVRYVVLAFGDVRHAVHSAALSTSKWPPALSTPRLTMLMTSVRNSRASGFIAELIGGALSS